MIDHRPDTVPLSASQQLFWSGQRVSAGVPLYNMALAFTISGPVDHGRFRRAFTTVVDRNEALRTIFVESDGQAEQIVRESINCEVPLLDLSAVDDAPAAASEWMRSRASAVFDLSDRLTDAALIRLSEDEYVFYLNQHHLVTDATSGGIVFRELARAYHESGDPQHSPRSPSPQFRDHVDFLHRVEGSAIHRAAREFWAERSSTPVAEYRPYGVGPESRTTRSVRIACNLGSERGRALRQLAARSTTLSANVGLFDVLASLLYAVLYRTSALTHLALAVPAHNRSRAEARNVVGALIEMFEHRLSIDPGETFRSLRDKCARESMLFMRHATPGASGAVPPAANAVLNFITARYGDFGPWSARADWIHAGHADSHHYVRLQALDLDDSGELDLYFDLNEAAFPPEDRTRFVSHFLALVDAWLDDPDAGIDAVDIRTDAEIEKAAARNETAVEFEYEDVLKRFYDVADANRDAMALSGSGSDYSYATLVSAIAGASFRLREAGVSPGASVALLAGRSTEAIVAMLGVLEAGGAYVPLDPLTPESRLRAMLGRTSCRVLITDHPTRVPGDFSGQVIPIDTLVAPLPLSRNPSTPAPAARPADLAYTIHTSGSTGIPKGVDVSRGALANYLNWACQAYGGGRVSMPVFTSLSVDLTVTSIFVPLLTGGTAVVYPSRDESPGLEVVSVLNDDAVDAVKLTPSHLALLAGRPTRASRVRTLILGGENLRSTSARNALAAFSGAVVLYNEYGPTEATVGCTVHRFDAARDRSAFVPIGGPIANMRVLVVNEALMHVPDGVPGELLVGGPGLAEGYRGDTGSTEAAFTSAVPGYPGRWYRTGDVVRWGGRGLLECLGRTDHQLKVRGRRVDAGEIESALCSLPGVTEAVAVVVTADLTREPMSCSRCGLSSTYPFVTFDENRVCSTCRDFERVESKARGYFGRVEELEGILRKASGRSSSKYDCIVLLSGGKDSTYALYRVAGMGLRVLAYTLDNGYISDNAKANIKRVVESLGVDHEYGRTDSMNEIFVDSLRRFSNVCNGCFKTIYTLSLARAHAGGIPVIVTGLSRGQFFETRLTEELFTLPTLDTQKIDNAVLAARKAYHRTNDVVNRLLNTGLFETDEVFDEVRVVDFYRYCDVSLDEMMAFLQEHASWIRPEDTGRSTNCLINDVGIYVHKQERGYHNYALPYSWDVRMGVKTREEAIVELEDDIDEANVRRILSEIGYSPRQRLEPPILDRLVAYYVSDRPLRQRELRTALSSRLPAYMIPDLFMRMPFIPTTAAGKVDRAALPAPEASVGSDAPEGAPESPRNAIEGKVAEIWSAVLGKRDFGVHDDFVGIGGTSLHAIQVVSRVSNAFRIEVPLQSAFDRPTVAALSELIEELLLADIQS